MLLGLPSSLGFLAAALYKSRNYHEIFVVEKKPEFKTASSSETVEDSTRRGGSGLVVVHERVYLAWWGERRFGNG